MATVMLVYLRNTKTRVSDSGHHQTQRPLKAAAVGCQFLVSQVLCFHKVNL